MINLLQSDIDIDGALKEHWKYFNTYLHIKLKGINSISNSIKLHPNLPRQKYKVKSQDFNVLEDFLTEGNNLKNIVIAQPKTLLKLHKTLITKINLCYGNRAFESYLDLNTNKSRKNHPVHKLYTDITSLFNYGEFISFEPSNKNYSAYKLADNLGVRSCTYCNRTYTITRRTHSEKKLMRPQFDHWFPKKKLMTCTETT